VALLIAVADVMTGDHIPLGSDVLISLLGLVALLLADKKRKKELARKKAEEEKPPPSD
jgi:hypothetical protein